MRCTHVGPKPAPICMAQKPPHIVKVERALNQGALWKLFLEALQQLMIFVRVLTLHMLKGGEAEGGRDKLFRDMRLQLECTEPSKRHMQESSDACSP